MQIMPYLYTLFWESSNTNACNETAFHDPKADYLRKEQGNLIGSDLLVIPKWNKEVFHLEIGEIFQLTVKIA